MKWSITNCTVVLLCFLKLVLINAQSKFNSRSNLYISLLQLLIPVLEKHILTMQQDNVYHVSIKLMYYYLIML